MSEDSKVLTDSPKNMHRMYQWLLYRLFAALIMLACSWGYYAIVATPTTVTLPLMAPYISGLWAAEEVGAWTTGDTRLITQAFGHLPWRKMTLKWRQQAGNAQQVTVKTPTKTLLVTHTEPRWRTAYILLDMHATQVFIESETVRVAGDRRDLGVFLKSPTIAVMKSAAWVHILWLVDICLPLVLSGWLLWRGRWWGVVAFVSFALVYGGLLWTESQATVQPALLVLDTNLRHGLIIVMAVVLWRRWLQRHGVVRADQLPVGGRRFGLDVMRAIAILSVVFAHVNPFIFAEWSGTPSIFRWTLYLGAVGVDIFFALSGYLISSILLRILPYIHERAILVRFWVRRWLRTLPAAYVSAVVVWVIAPPRFFSDYLASILFVGSFNPMHMAVENPHWWSLSTEELFYLFVPLMLYVGVRRWPRQHVFLTTLGIVVVVAVTLRVIFLSILSIELAGHLTYTSYIRLDSIVWGILIQWMRVRYPDHFVRVARSGFAPGAFMLLAGALLMLDQTSWLRTSLLVGHILTTAGAALLIPAFETVTTSGYARIDRVVTGISLISYSLYLYNNMMADAIVHQFGMATSWPMLVLMIGGYLLATGVASTISYRYVEVPVLRWRDRKYPEQLPDRPTV